ncbi:MAG: hypothetical protein GEU99_23130 [Luteitalea sp.]|nr:hypothetical protein [Luteitalea sp.]
MTASDPGAAEDTSRPFQASDPKIRTSEIGPDKIHLQESAEQHGNWVEAILKREQAISPAEVAHRYSGRRMALLHGLASILRWLVHRIRAQPDLRDELQPYAPHAVSAKD